MTDRNLGREVGELLVDEHGFARDDRVPGRFFRVVDSQHALVFWDADWDKGPGGYTWKAGYLTVSAQLFVARRDINELALEIYDKDIFRHPYPTVRVDREIRPMGFGRYTGQFEGFNREVERDVPAWIDSWLPEFAERTPNMPLLTQSIAKQAAHPRGGGVVSWVRWMTAMLDGWTEADEQEFLLVEHDAKTGPDTIDSFSATVERTRAWLAEHPDGIERELMD